MNITEYNLIKHYSYSEYCNFLKNKYSTPHYGLFKHHIHEDKVAGLSNPEVLASEKYKNEVIFCNFLEHLLLHILIGEQTDARKALGLGGAIHYIIPQIENYLDNNISCYDTDYYNNIDKEVFNLLKDRCDRAIESTSIALDHNTQLYLEVENTLKNKNRAVVVLGTGLGKTTTALEYIWKNRCRALVICPNILIKDGWDEYSDWVDLTTYQEFANRYSTTDFSKYGLVIVDEIHHAAAPVWGSGIKYLIKNNIKVLGLTATPVRSDGVDVGDILFKDAVCEGYSVEDGIEKGLIHPFSYITALYDTDGIHDEYATCDNKELVGQLDLAINNHPSLKEIFKNNMPEGSRKGIIFIQEIEDEKYVHSIMKDIYPDIEYRTIHSNLDSETNARNREWFENTDSGYLLAVNMISEGAHYRGVNTLIMFRRTNSYLVYTQQLGRIITLTKNENPNAIVFDLVNNIDNIEYNVTKNKAKYSITRIINSLKKTNAAKSKQIIIKDCSRDIVKAIREIKAYTTRRWLPEEEAILIEYYPKEGKKVAKRLKTRSANQCGDHAVKLGLKYINPYIWSKEEDEIIRKWYPIEGTKVLKKLPNKSITGLLNRVYKLGIKAEYYGWSEDEVTILIEYYSIGGKYEAKKYLPNKSLSQIASKASGLYLKSPNHKKKVKCIETNAVYDSAAEASRRTGIKNIDGVCRGCLKTAGGYHWEYAED